MMTANSHESVGRAARYAQHVAELAAAFGVKVQVFETMPPDAAGAGWRVRVCESCGQRNALKRPGTVRCGKCKAPLGTVDTVHAIMIAPVIDETTYAVALHELGHPCSAFGMINHVEGSSAMRRENRCDTLRDVRLQLEEERAAWAWAQHYALEWTPAMTFVMREALATYERAARKVGVK
jgi:hypothetical protein